MGTINGLSTKETLLLPVGMVFDLMELYLQANGKRTNSEAEE